MDQNVGRAKATKKKDRVQRRRVKHCLQALRLQTMQKHLLVSGKLYQARGFWT